MGTFIRYLIYIALVVIAVIIFKNLWDGSLTPAPVISETLVTVSPDTNAPASRNK